MQLMGGHGYIRENGVEQLVRDCRIFQLYEGANGVQAFDLALRKLPAADGRVLDGFLALVEASAEAAEGSESLRDLVQALREASGQLKVAATWLASPERDPYDIGGSSYDLLNMVGIVAIASTWLRAAAAAEALMARGDAAPFLARKLALARYWFERELPMVKALGLRVAQSSACLMALPAESF